MKITKTFTNTIITIGSLMLIFGIVCMLLEIAIELSLNLRWLKPTAFFPSVTVIGFLITNIGCILEKSLDKRQKI